MRGIPPQPFRRRARSRWTARRRPKALPRFWRNITGPRGIKDYVQRRDWQLVLNACGIPYMLTAFRKREYIYVPPLLEQHALKELSGFEAELAQDRAPQPLPVHARSLAAILFLLPLILWHGWRFGWWPAPDFLPPPSTWLDAGVLDNVLLRVYGQAYRLVTALTLHADLPHLWSNMAVGALFLPLLARMIGVGRALWLTMLGGILGNGLAAWLRPQVVLSIGFSTALFAAVGILAGFMACQQHQRRKAMLPVAAGAALLAMLGAGGENSDYTAHVCGLLCGLVLGICEAWRLRRHWPALPQTAAAALALAVPVLAWYWAFAARS